MQLVVCGVRRPVQFHKSEQPRGIFRAHAPPHGVCDNLIHADKLLANQYQDGDSPVRVLAEGLLERSRLKMTEELRMFILMDNHGAIKIANLKKAQESRQVGEPKFTEEFPDAVVR